MTDLNFTPAIVLVEGAEPLPSEAKVTWDIHTVSTTGGPGEPVGTETGGTISIALQPGSYFVRAGLDQAVAEQVVKVTAGSVAAPVFVLNAGLAVIRPYSSEGSPISVIAAIVVELPVEEPPTFYGETRAYFPAGTFNVKATIGNGEANKALTVIAGKTVEIDVFVGVGRVAVKANYTDGMPFQKGLAVSIRGPAVNDQGEREEVAWSYGSDTAYDLTPGEYVVVTSYEGASDELALTMIAGQLIEVVGNLNAGFLNITAPGAILIEVRSVDLDSNGNPARARRVFNETSVEFTMAAGDYIIQAHISDDISHQASATVTAGVRTAVTLG